MKQTIYADTEAIQNARNFSRQRMGSYFKGTDLLELNDCDADMTEPQVREKVRESYDMGTAPSTARELLQQYNILVCTFEKGKIGTVRVDDQDREISDVVTQGNLHKWNPQLLPNTVRRLRMKDETIQMTLKQPLDVTTETKHWTAQGYTALGSGEELLILKDDTALCTISGNKVYIPKNNLKEYITNMREM